MKFIDLKILFYKLCGVTKKNNNRCLIMKYIINIQISNSKILNNKIQKIYLCINILLFR